MIAFGAATHREEAAVMSAAVFRTVHRVGALVAACVLTVGLLGGWAGTAQAAPRLESSTPEDGGSIPAGGPVEIVLRFGEPLRSDDASLVLVGEDSGRRLRANVQIEGETLHGLLPEVPPGNYRASYRATTESGDTADGELSFTVSAPAVSLLGLELPSWAPTALVVLFVAIAALAVIVISAGGPRRA